MFNEATEEKIEGKPRDWTSGDAEILDLEGRVVLALPAWGETAFNRVTKTAATADLGEAVCRRSREKILAAGVRAGYEIRMDSIPIQVRNKEEWLI
jgi:hypothetical protein